MMEDSYVVQVLRAGHAKRHGDGLPVEDWLYRHCYTVRYAAEPVAATSERGTNTDIRRELSAANAGRAGWDLGWTIDFVLPDGRISAEKASSRRMFAPGEFITGRGPDRAPSTGDPIQVYAPVEAAHGEPYWYFAFGETVCPVDKDFGYVRLYWNIGLEGAVLLVEQVTTVLNRFQVPFRFKIVCQANEFKRMDAGVLYVSRHFWPFMSMLLPRIHGRVSDFLDNDTLPFTKRLQRGLSLAEDPGGARSFGQQRCDLLASIIGRQADEAKDAEWLKLYREGFLASGVDPDQPWLNPKSMDIYEPLPGHC